MKKTIVRLSPDVLAYRQAMTELVERHCRETTIAGVDRHKNKEFLAPRTEVLELCLPGLLAHPQVESLWPALEVKDGCLDGLILIQTTECYRIMSVYVLLEDDQGNPIESGYAFDNPIMENHWGYVPTAAVSPGTTVVVRAIAMDQLGGLGMKTERVTV